MVKCMMAASSSRASFGGDDDNDDEEPNNKLQSLLDQSDVSTSIIALDTQVVLFKFDYN